MKGRFGIPWDPAQHEMQQVFVRGFCIQLGEQYAVEDTDVSTGEQTQSCQSIARRKLGTTLCLWFYGRVGGAS